MTDTRLLRRHRAYFSGWAQAFGHHALHDDSHQGLRWLVGEGQLGLILDPSMRTRIGAGEDQTLGGLLADEPCPPAAEPAGPRAVRKLGQAAATSALIDVGSETLRLGRLTLRHCPLKIISTLRTLINAPRDLHLFESYHLVYPKGTRILTLSQQAPLGLIYRELPPTLLRTAPLAQPAATRLRAIACA